MAGQAVLGPGVDHRKNHAQQQSHHHGGDRSSHKLRGSGDELVLVAMRMAFSGGVLQIDGLGDVGFNGEPQCDGRGRSARQAGARAAAEPLNPGLDAHRTRAVSGRERRGRVERRG